MIRATRLIGAAIVALAAATLARRIARAEVAAHLREQDAIIARSLGLEPRQ